MTKEGPEVRAAGPMGTLTHKELNAASLLPTRRPHKSKAGHCADKERARKPRRSRRAEIAEKISTYGTFIIRPIL